MKAIIIDNFGDSSVFEERELSIPEVIPGHVLIEVKATSVNPVDCRIRSGEAPGMAPALPAVLHGDVAGIIVAVGEGVSRFRAGDEVFGLAGGTKGTASGALADYMLADASLLALKPQSLSMAEAAALDLVEISPNAEPPVCRIMNYGKFLYEKSKTAKEQKKKQKVVQVKEIKFRPGTDEGDYQVKLRSLIRFLEDGDKTKITIRFRGREMAHQQIGADVLERVKNDLADVAVVESAPSKLEGRQMVMVLAPKKK